MLRPKERQAMGMEQLVPGVWYEPKRGWMNIEVELANDGNAWEALIGGTNQMECTAVGFGATPAEAVDEAMKALAQVQAIPEGGSDEG
jgi:hypothetical protein